MRIVILFNPVAGGGRGEAAALALQRRLEEAGHAGVPVASRRDAADDPPASTLDRADVLAVVGGDGAVRAAAGPASRSGTPIYHVPVGTENLFAREFRMDGRPETFLEALRRFEVRTVDAGEANGLTFTLMASVGYDAEVVHDLAATRGVSISHRSYLAPMWRQLRAWRPPTLAVTLDGRRIDRGGPGGVVVANSRQYAWRLDPARRADVADGLLDVVIMPIRGRADLLGWIGRCRSGRHLRHRRLVYARGRHVEIECVEPRRFQLDGDPPPGGVGAPARRLDVRVRPGALRVLAPP